MTAAPIEKPDFTGLRAMYINCTLNRLPGRSHTQGLIDRGVAIMEASGSAWTRFAPSTTTSPPASDPI